ncbi:MAG: peptide-methionine (S)-S-oxide reductase [Candidatus Solincola sediminis]|uniref:Peptide methionine sulfoxide reductase MsrA n=1 Tax=Candidatus Solincola sediminis TaxID=1797199 RepID=A0A1F2WRD8_9ACTN|nr:MAG: peptide-methionine (S)-S-oxide reductase [Candidatus Solincola sediminis]OFW60222.1 MAG: peptide-methionine (S)-S-oxide reductase [Candidatus Solincola sediminis]
MRNNNQTIVLGGGCFWCMEAIFNELEGIINVTAGYAGGFTRDPSYSDVCAGTTGHAEAISLEYDPEKISLEDILDVFFLTHDSTSLNRQGADVGTQYRSIILYTSEQQREQVDTFINRVRGDYDQPVVTEVKPLERFYTAEEYHQRYFERNQNLPYCRLVISPKLDKLRKLRKKAG